MNVTDSNTRVVGVQLASTGEEADTAAGMLRSAPGAPPIRSLPEVSDG
jgi:hypothetical protein